MSKVPQGFHTITPSLSVENAAEAINLYTKAFGATVDYRMDDPQGSGKIMHACLQIGNSKLFIADVMPNCGAASSSGFYLYFNDADANFKQATSAGLEVIMPVTDMFWGDRMGAVKDKFGITWNIATQVREVSPEELAEGAKKFTSNPKAA